ncbi:MAG: c-type cytochrome domain-containing protein [Planctomycetota bacterium]
MRHPLLTVVTLVFTSSLLAQGKPAASKVEFEKDILPILEKNCVKCHSTAKAGPDGKVKKPKGGVVFDSKDGITASKKGKLVVAKKPDDSLVYQAITLAADHEDRMPPAKEGAPLSKDQTDLIKKWIEEGASFGKWVGAKADDKAKDGGKDKEKEKEGGDKPKDHGKEGDKPKDKPEPPKSGHGD